MIGWQLSVYGVAPLAILKKNWLIIKKKDKRDKNVRKASETSNEDK